jgi:hypothetical protein
MVQFVIVSKMDVAIVDGGKDTMETSLESKYGVVRNPNLLCARGNKNSLWWNNFVGLGVLRDALGDWIRDILARKMGNGRQTNFWSDSWLNAISLKVIFPRLFLLSTQKDLSICQMGDWVNES